MPRPIPLPEAATARPDDSWGRPRLVGGHLRRQLCFVLVAEVVLAGLQGEVQAKGLVEGGEELSGDDADSLADAFDRYRSDLFSLSFRVAVKTGLDRLEEYLERVHLRGVRGDRHDGDDASSQTRRGSVCAIVADDHCGSPLVGLCANHGFEIDHTDLASTH
jgi:hypothetical protein